MPSHRLHQIVAAAAPIVATTMADATSSISDYLSTDLTGDIAVDRNYWYGSTINTSGAGQFAIADSLFSGASLRTFFGAMSGAVNADPPTPPYGAYIVARQARAEATGEFTDTFHFSSDTLAYGTPVTLLLTVTLDGTVARSASNEPLPYMPLVYAGWGPGPDYPLAALQTAISGSQVGAVRWSTYVGASFDLVGVLHLRTDGLESLGSIQANQTQDGTGSAHFYLDALTPGVTVSTGSGWNYASPVPEPAPAALLALGLAAIRLLGRRRHALAL
jgi:hypothetical protein